MGRRFPAAYAAGLATLLGASSARADDSAEVAGAVIGVLAAIGIDTGFTVHDAVRVDAREEPDAEWMVSQSTVVGAQAVVLNFFTGFAAASDRREEGITLAFLAPTIWTNALSTFSIWTLSSEKYQPAPFGRTLAIDDDTNVRDRFAMSWVVGINLAFTSSVIGSAAGERWVPRYISIPQTVLMAPECVLASIKAGVDDHARAGWVTMAAWSGVLTIHGVASIIGGGDGSGFSSNDDGPRAAKLEPPPFVIVPAPIDGAAGSAPGLALFASF